MNDRSYLRLYTAIIVLAVVIAATLVVSWFFEVDIQSRELWVGSFIAFITLSILYSAPFWLKILNVFFSIAAISYFLIIVFGLSVGASVMASMFFEAIMVFMYLTVI